MCSSDTELTNGDLSASSRVAWAQPNGLPCRICRCAAIRAVVRLLKRSCWPCGDHMPTSQSKRWPTIAWVQRGDQGLQGPCEGGVQGCNHSLALHAMPACKDFFRNVACCAPLEAACSPFACVRCRVVSVCTELLRPCLVTTLLMLLSSTSNLDSGSSRYRHRRERKTRRTGYYPIALAGSYSGQKTSSPVL